MSISAPPVHMPRGYYVYEHIKQSTGEVFYVGKGINERAWVTYNRSAHWKRIMAKHGVRVRIVADCLQEWYAYELESELIQKYGRVDLKTGTLVNKTDGGYGASGTVCSDEKRQKIIASRTPEFRAKISAVHTGRKRPLSTVAKISAAKKGKKFTDEHKKAIGDWQRGTKRGPMSQQTKHKIGEANRGRKHSDGTRAVISAKQSHKTKPVYCAEMQITFLHCRAAASWLREIGFAKASRVSVVKVAKGINKKAYGYTWQYVDKENPA